MFGQSLLSGAFGTALVPGENFGINLYTGTGANQPIGGKIKGAASLNGSSSAITTPDQVVPNGACSISCWYNPEGSTGTEYILGQGIATASKGPTVYWYNQSFGALVAKGTSSLAGSATGSTTYPTTGWYNVIFTWDGTSNSNAFKVYVNGSLLVEGTSDTSSASIGAYTYFGIGGLQGGSYANGSVDQVRVFNTVLSASQISSLASETSATAATLNFPSGAGCLAAYQLDTNFSTILSQDDLSTVNFPSGTTGAALYQFENSANGDAGPNPTTTTDLTYVDGAFGKALDFNGSSSVWQSTNQIIDSHQDFTISMWVKVDAYATSTYLWTSYATGDWGISMSGNAGSNYFSFHKWNNNFAGTYVSLDSPSVATLGKWYHLCGTFSTSTGMVFYIDGTSVGTDSTTWPGKNHGAYSDSIGCYGYTPSGNRANFNGQIDQFRAYQQVLTAAQVLELAKGDPKYNMGSTTANLNGWVGFKPDLTWIKKRNGGTGNNLLQNTVNGTGTGSSLSSNSTTAAGNFDQYGYLSSFNEQGFTTQGGSSGSYPYDNLGESGSGYVSWNWKAGADTYAGYFNGSSTKITTDYTTNDSEFSISAWVYYRGDVASQYNYIASKGFYSSSSSTNYFSFQTYFSQYPELRVRLNNSTNVAATSSVGLSAGKWYHLVGTCDSSGNLKVYVNGTETGSASGAPARSMGQAMYIGSYFDGSWASGFFKGEINNFRYFNQAISASEVTSLYNEGLSDNNTLDFPTGAGCTAAWPLNGSADPLSGSSMSGTPVDLKFVKSGYTGKNNDGTIESQISANPDYGFSIVKWVGSGTSGDTVGHGLTPASKSMLVIMKDLSASNDWMVMTNDLWSTPNQQYLKINTDAAVASSGADIYNVNNTTFKNDYRNTAGSSYIAYCWHSVPKYSKLGTYTGDGNTSGHVITTGFEPSWIMFKPASAAGYWYILDNKRSQINPRNDGLFPNDAAAEIESTNYNVDFLSTGFELKNNTIGFNQSGTDYIYVAFA
tara:strand:- start:40 stop:3051 length:3012 start_codon:yes stop_codon:yes gene_type:complete